MRRIPLHYPLEWPAGKPRTTDRGFGRYHNNKRDITLAEAQTRLYDSLDKFNNQGKGWVVDLEACRLKTMFDLNQNGSMRRGQRTPPDVGVVLFFNMMDSDTDLNIEIDCYTKIEQNVAAIAACVDSLRQLWRVDAGTFLAAASGLNALPPPDVLVMPSWRTVLSYKQDETPTLDEVKRRYRVMRSAAHPDNGGNASVMADLSRAWGDAQVELEDA